jgi:hypothetical protein
VIFRTKFGSKRLPCSSQIRMEGVVQLLFSLITGSMFWVTLSLKEVSIFSTEKDIGGIEDSEYIIFWWVIHMVP